MFERRIKEIEIDKAERESIDKGVKNGEGTETGGDVQFGEGARKVECALEAKSIESERGEVRGEMMRGVRGGSDMRVNGRVAK